MLLTARAMEIEGGDPFAARTAALEAHRLDPELVPAAVVAGRLLTRSGDVRKATRVLESTWRLMPHPDLADAYAAVRPGDSVRDRLKRMRRLADFRANHPEGAMAVARAAIDARDFEAARGALDGLARGLASERVCLLMAEIEEREHGDQGRVRVWLTRALSAPRDPAWVADGRVSERWAPVSPYSGRVGAYEWRVATAAMPREALEIGEERDPSLDLAAPDAPGPILITDQARSIEPLEAVVDVEPVGASPVQVEPVREPPPPPAPPPTPAPPYPSPRQAPPLLQSENPPATEPGQVRQEAEAKREPVAEDGSVPMRAPDDPGPPLPDETGEETPRRRFRLF